MRGSQIDENGRGFDPDFYTCGWGTEVRELMGTDPLLQFGDALDQVAVRYLGEGDSRPLLHLLWRGRLPGVRLQRYVGAMISADSRADVVTPPIYYKIQLQPRRNARRPHKDEYLKAEAACAEIRAAFSQAEEGCHVPPRVWVFLFRSLREEIEKNLSNAQHPAQVPVIGRLVRLDGRKGRSVDPELAMRDKVIGWKVGNKIGSGAPYKRAIHEVTQELPDPAWEKQWGIRLTPRTIRGAYERSKANL